MARRTVNIELRASGGRQVAGELGKAGKASTDLIVNIRKLGNAFGEIGGNIGGLVSNILKGGIWGIAATAAKGVMSLASKAWENLKKAEKEALEASLRIYDTQARGLANLAAAQKKVFAAREASINSAAQSYKKELDAVHDLTKANLELARAQARARGDTSAVASIDVKMKEEDAAAQRAQLVRNIADARKRLKVANEAKTAAGELKARAEAEIKENNATMPRTNLNDEDTRARRNALIRANRANYKTRAGAEKSIVEADEKGDKAYEDLKSAQLALEAFDKRQAAQRIEAENAEREKAEEERKKAAEERKKAAEEEAREVEKFNEKKKQLEKSIADERRRLALEEARERDRLDRELHKKRMDDLRAEIDAQKEEGNTLRSRASAAQSEFDKAFAMYRDPSRAAEEIGEEKDYQNDLDRLHRDARGYGGKWRIDELSRLMSAGDTQGVTDTLKEWRRSKGFTPEIEAMVRASAAEKTKTTAEDELRKVNDKVASMSEVLKQIADSQSGKLGAIADSTSGLAAKVDQLLQVKG